MPVGLQLDSRPSPPKAPQGLPLVLSVHNSGLKLNRSCTAAMTSAAGALPPPGPHHQYDTDYHYNTDYHYDTDHQCDTDHHYDMDLYYDTDHYYNTPLRYGPPL